MHIYAVVNAVYGISVYRTIQKLKLFDGGIDEMPDEIRFIEMASDFLSLKSYGLVSCGSFLRFD